MLFAPSTTTPPPLFSTTVNTHTYTYLQDTSCVSLGLPFVLARRHGRHPLGPSPSLGSPVTTTCIWIPCTLSILRARKANKDLAATLLPLFCNSSHAQAREDETRRAAEEHRTGLASPSHPWQMPKSPNSQAAHKAMTSTPGRAVSAERERRFTVCKDVV